MISVLGDTVPATPKGSSTSIVLTLGSNNSRPPTMRGHGHDVTRRRGRKFVTRCCHYSVFYKDTSGLSIKPPFSN